MKTKPEKLEEEDHFLLIFTEKFEEGVDYSNFFTRKCKSEGCVCGIKFLNEL